MTSPTPTLTHLKSLQTSSPLILLDGNSFRIPEVPALSSTSSIHNPRFTGPGPYRANEQLFRLSQGGISIDLTEEAWEGVRTARAGIDNILKEGKVITR